MGNELSLFFPSPPAPADRSSSWSFHFVRRKNERRRRRHAIPRGLRPPRDAMLDFVVQMLVHSNLHGRASSFESRAGAKSNSAAIIDFPESFLSYKNYILIREG